MAEIIKGRFGEPKKDNPQEQPEQKKDQETEFGKTRGINVKKASQKAFEAEEDGDPRAQGISLLAHQDIADKVKAMGTFINSLAGFKPSKEVLATAEKHWMSLTPKELASAILGSSENQWTDDAGYFQALTREYYNRIHRILEQFSDPE